MSVYDNPPAPPVKKCDNCLEKNFCDQSQTLMQKDYGWYCVPCRRKFERLATDINALTQAMGKEGKRVYEPWEVVTGSREYPRMKFVFQVIAGLLTYPGAKRPTEMYVGDARGVDLQAAVTWKELTGKAPKLFCADWRKHGKAAGLIRNGIMVDAYVANGGGIALAFWDGKSRGTLDTMKKLRAYEKMVLVPEDFQDINKDCNQADLRLRIWQGEEKLT